MNPRSVMVLVLFALPVSAADPKADLTALKGTWEVVATTFNGNEVSNTGRSLVFGDREFTAYSNGKKGRTLQFTLDATASPKRIDLDRGGESGKAYGIYVIAKDELKLCYAEPGGDRPTAFESKEGSKVFLIVLKRGKD